MVVFIALLAALLMQSGTIVWKVVGDRLPTIGKASVGKTFRAFVTSPLWLLGLLIVVLGWLLFIKALDLAEVTIVQPLLSATNLLVVAVMVVFFGERLRSREVVGVLLTVGGAVALSLQAKVVDPPGVDWQAVAWFFGGTLALGALLHGVARRTRSAEFALAVAAGLAFGTSVLLTKIMTAWVRSGGHDLVSSAAVVNPILPLIVVANFTGLILLQAGFQRGRASVVVPVQSAVAIGFVVAGGLGVIDESLDLHKAAGLLAVISGAALCGHLKARRRTG